MAPRAANGAVPTNLTPGSYTFNTAGIFLTYQTQNYPWAYGQYIYLRDNTFGSSLVYYGTLGYVAQGSEGLVGFFLETIVSVSGSPAGGETTSSDWTMSFAAAPAGAQGAQAAAGAQGAQGAVGSQGNQGAQGSVGPQGSQAANGNQGAAGNQGSQGAIGSQGLGTDIVTYAQGANISVTSGNIDDYNLPGQTFFILTGTVERDITGFQNGTNGRMIVLINNTSTSQNFKDESSSSTASNRLYLTNDVTVIAPRGGSATFLYSTDIARWAMISHT